MSHQLPPVDLQFPTKCGECGREFESDGPRRYVVYAGSAWKDGVAVIENGAELYYTKAFHPDCAPPSTRS